MAVEQASLWLPAVVVLRRVSCVRRGCIEHACRAHEDMQQELCTFVAMHATKFCVAAIPCTEVTRLTRGHWSGKLHPDDSHRHLPAYVPLALNRWRVRVLHTCAF